MENIQAIKVRQSDYALLVSVTYILELNRVEYDRQKTATAAEAAMTTTTMTATTTQHRFENVE